MEAWTTRQYAALLALQSGVGLAATALHDAGLQPHDLKRLLRQPRPRPRCTTASSSTTQAKPTWLQRAWAAATLYAGDSALCHDSALRAAEGPGKSPPPAKPVIHVAIDPAIARIPVAGRMAGGAPTRGLRRQGAPQRLAAHGSGSSTRSWTLRPEAGTDFAAVGALTDAVSARRTTRRPHPGPRSRSSVSDSPPGFPRGRALRHSPTELTRCWSTATCSEWSGRTLFRAALGNWLKPPPPARSTATSPTSRSARLRRARRPGQSHGTAYRPHDHDLARDLAPAVTDQKVTVRLGWGQVYGDHCSDGFRVGGAAVKRAAGTATPAAARNARRTCPGGLSGQWHSWSDGRTASRSRGSAAGRRRRQRRRGHRGSASRARRRSGPGSELRRSHASPARVRRTDRWGRRPRGGGERRW